MDDTQQPVIVAPTSRNLAPRRAPAPRPQNVEIMTQRAKSARGSNKERSRSPQSVSSRITGVQDLPHPPQDLPPGQWISPGLSPSGPQRPFSAFPFNPAPGTSTVIRPSGPYGGDLRSQIPPPPPVGQTSYVLA